MIIPTSLSKSGLWTAQWKISHANYLIYLLTFPAGQLTPSDLLLPIWKACEKGLIFWGKRITLTSNFRKWESLRPNWKIFFLKRKSTGVKDLESTGWMLVIVILSISTSQLQLGKKIALPTSDDRTTPSPRTRKRWKVLLKKIQYPLHFSKPELDGHLVYHQSSSSAISQELIDWLSHPFSKEDVKKALSDLNPSKAPGLDGFTALFFKNAWDTIGEDLSTAALKVLNDDAPLFNWNETIVTLIPKVKEPSTIQEYMPISLCNVCYKTVARAITNHLKGILDKIIGPFQSAFVPGRAITNNIIIGYECMHWLRNSNSKQGYVALKLDMSKAYDRVDWTYLQAILNALGFPSKWVSLIMRCVSSVSYSFKVNNHIFVKSLLRGAFVRVTPFPHMCLFFAHRGFQPFFIIKRNRMNYKESKWPGVAL